MPMMTPKPVLTFLAVAMMVEMMPAMVANIGLSASGLKNGTISTTVMAMMIAPPKGASGEFSLVKKRINAELSDNKNGNTREAAVKIIIATTAIISVVRLRLGMIFTLSVKKLMCQNANQTGDK